MKTMLASALTFAVASSQRFNYAERDNRFGVNIPQHFDGANTDSFGNGRFDASLPRQFDGAKVGSFGGQGSFRRPSGNQQFSRPKPRPYEDRKDKFELVQAACPRELTQCGWEEDVRHTEEEREQIKDCFLALPLDGVSTFCQPVLAKAQQQAELKEENREERVERLKETCPKELAGCGFFETDRESKEDMEKVKECILDIPVESVSKACQPDLNHLQSKLKKFGKEKREEKREEFLDKLEEFCPNELSECGFYEADRESKEEMKQVKECLEELPLDDVSPSCEPILTVFQKKLSKAPAGRRPRGPHHQNGQQGGRFKAKREEIEAACYLELVSCGYQGDDSVAGEDMRQVMKCFKGLVTDSSSLSPACRDALPERPNRA